MKILLFICGSNGIGKTTICKSLLQHLPNSAYVDSDPCRYINPNVLDDDTIPTIRKNLTDLIQNYFHCPIVQTVIFSYGFHGRRKEIFDGILKDISIIEYRFIPIQLVCEETENIKRMKHDGRGNDQISRAILKSRTAYTEVKYPQIDITELSVEESVTAILALAQLKAQDDGNRPTIREYQADHSVSNSVM
jgi:Cdc6-like AAA superfamily ATPase